MALICPLQPPSSQLPTHSWRRHTKSQRIGGEQALALPMLKSDTILLDMSKGERIIYDGIFKYNSRAHNMSVAYTKGLLKYPGRGPGERGHGMRRLPRKATVNSLVSETATLRFFGPPPREQR